MRSLKNLNIEESLKCKKLIYTEDWYDKIDRFLIYLFFTSGFIYPFLIYFDPHIDQTSKGIGHYLVFFMSIFCAFTIYRKATEKKLTVINSQFDITENRKIINKYCQEQGLVKFRNSKNMIIYNSDNSFNLSSNFHVSRIFLLNEKSIYVTMIKDNLKMNLPVLVSQFFLIKDIKNLTR